MAPADDTTTTEDPDMPQLLLRGLDADTVRQVKAYARENHLTTPDAAFKLLRIGLEAQQSRAAGAATLNASRTPRQRSEAARRAVSARWAKTREGK